MLTSLTLQREDGGGIRVLDALQLRGLTFERVHLLGLNGGFVPAGSARGPDPSRTGCDARAASDGPARPDRASRPRVRRRGASAARRAARFGTCNVSTSRGSVPTSRVGPRPPRWRCARSRRMSLRPKPEMQRARDEATHLPSHPAHWLDCSGRATPGSSSPEEEMLLAALNSRAADAAQSLGSGAFPSCCPGLDMLRASRSPLPPATCGLRRADRSRLSSETSRSVRVGDRHARRAVRCSSCSVAYFASSPLEERAKRASNWRATS